MDLDTGELLTRWSVRLAVGCYVGRVLVDVRCGRANRCAATARWIWTVGCALYLVHVASAFAFFHDWSHSAALRHTAEQTAAVTGLDWGGGLYVNYAFTLFWMFDTLRWWCGGLDAPRRSAISFWVMHTVFAFMMINATVVFGPSYWRWLAPIVFLLFIVAYLSRRRGGESSAGGPGSC